MTYTRISFWRAGELSQCVEIDLASRTPHQGKRVLRVWLARMASLECDSAYTIRVQEGSAIA